MILRQDQPSRYAGLKCASRKLSPRNLPRERFSSLARTGTGRVRLTRRQFGAERLCRSNAEEPPHRQRIDLLCQQSSIFDSAASLANGTTDASRVHNCCEACRWCDALIWGGRVAKISMQYRSLCIRVRREVGARCMTEACAAEH